MPVPTSASAFPVRRRSTPARRAGAPVWPPRRDSAQARRQLAERVAATVAAREADPDREAVDPDSLPALCARYLAYRSRRDEFEAKRKTASRMMIETAKEAAEAFAEAGELALELELPSGDWVRVRPKRDVFPKYRTFVDADGDEVAGVKFGRADLFEALRADGYGDMIGDNIDQGAYNRLVAKLDDGGDGTLPPALARVIEAEPSWTVSAVAVKGRRSNAPSTDG